MLINKGLLTKEGAAYERAPQIRTGFNYNFGGVRAWKIQPEFAIVFPAFDDVPTNVADQLGFGERQGADSSRPASRRYLLFSHKKAQKAHKGMAALNYFLCAFCAFCVLLPAAA